MSGQKAAIKRDLTSGRILTSLLRFVGPLFLSNVLQTVYTVVDMSIVGHFIGSTGLSAVSACGDIMNVLMFLAMGFSNAGQVLISQFVGAGEEKKISRMIGCLFTVFFCASVLFMAGTLVFHTQILDFANIPPEARSNANAYLLTSACGLLFIYGYNVISAILRGMGDSRHPLMFVAISSLTNIALDFIFVAGLSWGTFGAAFATVLAQGLSFTVSICFLYKRKEQFGFAFRLSNFKVEKESFSMLVKLGIPMAIQTGMIQFSKLIVTRWVNDYGVIVSSITGIGAKFNSIGLTFSSAIGTSAAAMIGQCMGAGKYERVKKTVFVAGGMSVSVITVINAFIVIFPQLAFGIFSSDPELLSLTGVYVPVVVITLYGAAFRAPMTGLINGVGNPKINLLIAIMDGIVGHIGLAALLGFACGLGIRGLWFGNASAGFIPFIIGLIYLIFVFPKVIKQSK